MRIVEFNDFSGYTIFCDDIRNEASGKINLIGCYRHVMLVQGDFPLVLPKFGFGIHVMQRREVAIRDVKIRVFLPGDPEDQPSIEGEAPKEAEDNAFSAPPDPLDSSVGQPIYMSQVWNLVLSPLVIGAEGHIKVRALLGEDITVKLGALRVAKALPPKTAASSGPAS